MEHLKSDHDKTVNELLKIDSEMMAKNPQKLIKQKEIQMNAAVKILDFETAAILRDEINAIKIGLEDKKKVKINKKK